MPLSSLVRRAPPAERGGLAKLVARNRSGVVRAGDT